MLVKLIVASALTLAADLPSLKDLPEGPVTSAVQPRASPVERRRGERLPGFVIMPSRRPYVKVEGYPGQFVVTQQELERWGLRVGDTIGAGLGSLIVQERLYGQGAKAIRPDEEE